MQSDRTEPELLSQIMTVHWLAQMFKDHGAASIDDYVNALQLSSSGESQTEHSLIHSFNLQVFDIKNTRQCKYE